MSCLRSDALAHPCSPQTASYKLPNALLHWVWLSLVWYIQLSLPSPLVRPHLRPGVQHQLRRQLAHDTVPGVAVRVHHVKVEGAALEHGVDEVLVLQPTVVVGTRPLHREAVGACRAGGPVGGGFCP